MAYGRTCCSKPTSPIGFRSISCIFIWFVIIQLFVWLTCLNPRYITRISCLENLVCRSSSSRATGLVVCCLVRALSKSNRASSGPGESGGVAISLSNQPEPFSLSLSFSQLFLSSFSFFFLPSLFFLIRSRDHTSRDYFIPLVIFFLFLTETKVGSAVLACKKYF